MALCQVEFTDEQEAQIDELQAFYRFTNKRQVIKKAVEELHRNIPRGT